MKSNYQLSNIKYIKRFVVGNNLPTNLKTEADIEQEMNLINSFLNGSGSTKGIILGIEKNFGIYNHGEHQIVQQYFVYHIGFERKPIGL